MLPNFYVEERVESQASDPGEICFADIVPWYPQNLSFYASEFWILILQLQAQPREPKANLASHINKLNNGPVAWCFQFPG